MTLKRFYLLVMFSVLGIGSMWADTSRLTAENGWSKVTDLTKLTLSDYYFVFVDNDKDLMLSFEEGPNQSNSDGCKTMVYRTGAKAEMNPAMLWIIDETPDKAMIRNMTSDKYLQCETNWNDNGHPLQPWYCHTNDVNSNKAGGESWARWGFAYADGKWTIKNLKHGSVYIGPWADGKFENGREVAGNKEGANIGYFQIYAIKRADVNIEGKATRVNPANYTYLINNANAGQNSMYGWKGEGNYQRHGNNGFDGVSGFFELGDWNASNSTGTISQTLSGLPVGKYQLRVAGQQNSSNTATTISLGTASANMPANGTSGGTILQTGEETTIGGGVDGWRYTTCSDMVTGGTVTIKISATLTASHCWSNVDNIELYYLGNGIENYAKSANAEENFTAEAGQWYEIPVATAGDYKFTIGSGSIIYTQDGSQGKDAATGTSIESEAICNLSAGSVFVKADAATTIKMEANTYSYELGALTLNHKDGAYVQTNGVITFTYPNAVTNDKSATATLVKSATATVNGEAKTLTAVTNGFQLDLGTLTPLQVFNISIPAGVYGYADKAMNDAITMTINTPAVFDGRYYLYNSYDKKYFSRGGSYGTQACVDEYGIAVILTTDENNATSVKMFDSYMNIGFDGFVYTDCQGGDVRYFNISLVEGGYKLLNTNNSKYLATNGGHVVADALEGGNLVGTSNIWTLEDVNNHLAVLKANDDKQAKAVAEAAGLKAETKVALESILAGEEYEARPITVTGTSGIQENYQGGSSGNQDSKPLDIFKETVTGLNPGIYKLSVNAFQRATWLEDVCQTGGARGKVYVYANDNKTQLKSIAEEPATEAYPDGKEVNGKYYPNNPNSAGVAFDKGMYVNDVYVYVTGNELTFGIQNPTRMGNDGSRGAWTAYRNFTLTYYAVANLDTYYNDLSAALLKYKPWTETGEYVTKYNEFSAACQNKTYTTKEEINAAISYLQTNYPTYAWDNANMEHPYLVSNVIKGAENNVNDNWPGGGRSTTSGQHWSGDASRIYFTQNHEDGAARSQTVTIPNKGVYILKSSVRTLATGAYAEISVGDIVERTSVVTGNTGGTIATDGTEYESVEAGVAAGATFANSNKGYGWIYNKIQFVTTSDNEQKTIKINLSNCNSSREADCGGMYLYYVGKNYDKVVGNTRYCYGTYNAPAFELTDEVPVVDASNASVTGATVTRTNPNGLVYLADGSTADGGNNVVIGGTCANLVLADGHPFVAPKAFEATTATYNMNAVATTSGGQSYGTLVLPYAVTTLPGKAYSLDQGVTFGDEIHATEVNAIAANKPVLVTAKGDYVASNVSVAATGATLENGELVGTYAAMTALEGTFVLQNHSGYVAFFMVTNTKPTVNPFRAYIKAQPAASKQYINVVFDDETNGITEIEGDRNEDAVIYDISGRKMTKAVKGLYIINGKKTIVK